MIMTMITKKTLMLLMASLVLLMRLVMELVHGQSLAELIKQNGPIDPLASAKLASQIADALAAAHTAGDAAPRR